MELVLRPHHLNLYRLVTCHSTFIRKRAPNNQNPNSYCQHNMLISRGGISLEWDLDDLVSGVSPLFTSMSPGSSLSLGSEAREAGS